MLWSSLVAIQNLLENTFPDVNDINIYGELAGSVRPSFYLELVSDLDEHLNRQMWASTITWRIVYYAPLDVNNHVDVSNQLQVVRQLQDKLMEQMTIMSLDEEYFNVLDCSIARLETGEISVNVRLQIDINRSPQDYDLINDIYCEFDD